MGNLLVHGSITLSTDYFPTTVPPTCLVVIMEVSLRDVLMPGFGCSRSSFFIFNHFEVMVGLSSYPFWFVGHKSGSCKPPETAFPTVDSRQGVAWRPSWMSFSGVGDALSGLLRSLAPDTFYIAKGEVYQVESLGISSKVGSDVPASSCPNCPVSVLIQLLCLPSLWSPIQTLAVIICFSILITCFDLILPPLICCVFVQE